MPIVEFIPSGRTVDVSPGTPLLDAARLAGVEIVSPCGGKGTCGKCIVKIRSGKVDTDSLGMLPADSVAEGNVLACKTKVLHQSIVVEVPEQQMSRESGKFVDAGEVHLIREELLPKEWEFDPLAVKWLLEVPPPQLEDGLSDVDRLTRTIQKQWGKEKVVYSIRVLRHVAEALRANDGQVTATLIREPDHLHVIRLEPGDTTTRLLGIAVDVGTTTVAVQLIHLTDNTERLQWTDSVRPGRHQPHQLRPSFRTPGGASRAGVEYNQPPGPGVGGELRHRSPRDRECGHLRKHDHDASAAWA